MRQFQKAPGGPALRIISERSTLQPGVSRRRLGVWPSTLHFVPVFKPLSKLFTGSRSVRVSILKPLSKLFTKASYCLPVHSRVCLNLKAIEQAVYRHIPVGDKLTHKLVSILKPLSKLFTRCLNSSGGEPADVSIFKPLSKLFTVIFRLGIS